MSKKTKKQELVLLGDGGVGKTALAASLCGKSFDPTTTVTTGIDTSFFLDDDREIQVTDYGGQQIYQEKYIEKVGRLDKAVVLIVVDTRSSDPSQRIGYWNSVLNGNEEIIKHLVITKSDMATHSIDETLVREKFGFKGIHKTSAKTAEGMQGLRDSINGAFELMTNDPDEGQDPVSIIIEAMAEQLCRYPL